MDVSCFSFFDQEKGVLVRVQGVPCYGGSFCSVVVLRYIKGPQSIVL